ncbi:MAG: sigma-70 family RNA polymerase sigma factor [Chloroflexota bacterium]
MVRKGLDSEERNAIKCLKQGDIGGLEVLVRRYQVQALEAACIITRNYQMAEDVVQSAFLHAYERINQFDSSRAFGPWFLRSVVNRALTTVSESNIEKSVPIESDLGQEELSNWGSGQTSGVGLTSKEPAPEDIFEATETREEIFAALDKLTPVQRSAIVLRYYLDLSDDEVSRRFDVPAGTVRRRLHDARERLKGLLAARTS